MSHGGLMLCAMLLSCKLLQPAVHSEGIICAQYDYSSSNLSLSMSHFGELLEPGKIYCTDRNCCMGLWRVIQDQLQPVLLSCLPKHAVCRPEVCKPVGNQSQYFSTQDEVERCAPWNFSCDWTGSAREQPRNASNFRDHVALVAAIPPFLILCVSVIIVLRKLKLGGLFISREEMKELQEVFTQRDISPPTLPVDGLSLLQVLREEGMSAHLWLGALHGRGVIIKCFSPPQWELYRKEWQILNLLTPFQHENIVRLLTAGSSTNGILENHQLLVLQHYPEGSLKNYLTGHTTDWTKACRLATSLARGLAFLHADIQREDVYKPAIAHRDLCSDNILVTDNSCCVISDFGLSVVLEGCQIMNKKAQGSAMISMTGTLRYMSPEMLDGSLNLMSWELALTQADVYSLGLLLWEIFSRCNDLYADHHAPEFQMVFMEELGQNPTLDELQSLVIQNNRRPQFPKRWSGNVQQSLALWETLEDCWDADSEARLSAQCTEQRLSNLCPSLYTS
ncbi:anti-Muellerian hormone type-2 receptor [Rhinophrynus dorsalis]